MNKMLQRELYIIKYGQTREFRIRKWVIITIVMLLLYLFFGWTGVNWFIVCAFILGVGIHFLFRYKTRVWTKPWWIMKKVIKTPFD